MSRAFRFGFVAALSLSVATCEDQAPTPPGRPANMLIISGNNQTGAAGAELPDALVAKITDSGGDPVPGQVVAFIVTAGGGHMFAGVSTSTATGEVRERWTLGTKAADPQQVEVRVVDAATGEKLTFGTFTATATVGAANKIVKVKGDGQVGDLASTLADSVTVKVTDQYGNPVNAATVNWSVTAGGGSANPTSSVTTPAGIAQTSWTLGTRMDLLHKVNATVGAVPDTVFSAEARLPASATVAFGGGNQAAVVGETLTDSFTVLVQLANGTPIPGDSTEWSPLHAGPLVSPTRNKTDVNGHAASILTFGPTLGTTAGTVTVRDRLTTNCGSTCRVIEWTAKAWTGGLTSITSGNGHSCGTIARGWAYCWGLGSSGQLGTGSTSGRVEPTFVASFQTFTALDAESNHTCALTAGRFAYCWGRSSSIATAVPGGRQFIDLATGGNHACGLEGGSDVYCWGSGSSGQLGDGTQGSHATPELIAGNIGFTQIAAGRDHTCGIRTTGVVYCWGQNTAGQLGDGTKTNRSAPVFIQSPLQFAQVAAAGGHTCALTSGGLAYCWGENGDGELGRGFTGGFEWQYPKPVAGGFTFTKLFAAQVTSCGLMANGQVRCWGGYPVNSSSPILVANGQTFSAVSGGGSFESSGFLCGLTSGGAAYCWGANSNGELGDGTNASKTSPTLVKWTTAP